MTTEQPSPVRKRSLSNAVAELRLQLADRERRIAELTEQSLQILDRLANARGAPDERQALQARIAELQEQLADTRQRIRLGSRAVLYPGAEVTAGVDVVVWGFAAAPEPQLGACAALAAERPVTLMMGPQHRVEEFARGAAPTTAVLETDCRTSAHYWNQAMASTQSDVVVLLAAGAACSPAAVERLAAAAAVDGVALATPRLSQGGKHSLGRVERALLELVPQPTAKVDGVEAVPFAAPEAFAISRAAYLALGPFDQDLLGDLALAEWAIRAASRSQRTVGVADADVVVPEYRVDQTGPAAVESDRLVVLARHRPQQLAAAALAADSLWQQDPGAVANVLRAAFRRLPRASEMPAAVDLLVVQAQTIAGWKRLAPSVRERLHGIAREMEVPVGDLVSDPGLVTLAERLQAAAAVLRQRGSEVESQHREVRELRGQADSNAARIRDLTEQVIARSNSIDALRHELSERERAIAALRQELGHRQGERDRFIDHLAQLQQEIEKQNEELNALRITAHEHVRLTEQNGLLRAENERLEQQLEMQQDHTREIERQLGKALGRTLELDPQLAEAKDTLKTLEQQLTEESRRLEGVLGEIDVLRGGHESLRREHGSLQEQRVELEARAHELVAALRDRERWIANLLQEVRQRRWRGRDLSPHEADFLSRYDPGPKP
ncbi:MAG: hypothetical protein AB7O97_05495 [Planctomycetota bacterium]